jgi:CheY-like chemotaxis protein
MPTRILIADDNPAVRAAMVRLLEDAGPWECVEAQNGQEALAKAQELRPSLIILDLVMPVMDGLAAAREMSKLLPDIPLFMHTLHWSPQVELEAQKVGVRKVVSKAQGKVLVSAVRDLLGPVPVESAPVVVDGVPLNAPPLSIPPLSVPPPTIAPTPAAIESGKASASDKPEAAANGQETPPQQPQS